MKIQNKVIQILANENASQFINFINQNKKVDLTNVSLTSPYNNKRKLSLINFACWIGKLRAIQFLVEEKKYRN